MIKFQKIVVVVGPTATNKTKLAITIAKEINGEIINADAFQVYKELNIGVNKPTLQELKEATFHLVGNVSILDKWDIKRFQDLANHTINKIYQKNKVPILVGGSHLYVDALINNYDLNESNERTNEFTNLSNDELKNELSKFNIVLANKIGSNRKRLIRALQIMKSGHKIDSKNKSFYGPLYIFCNKPRNQLYEDINKRVDLMIKNGWFEEVNKLISDFPNYIELNAFKAIGYLDIAQGLTHPNKGIDIPKIKQQVRRYAKRQLTWIRHHYMNAYEFNQNNINETIKVIKKWLLK